MPTTSRCTLTAVLLLTGTVVFAEDADRPAFGDEQIAFFEKKIRPVLVQNCFGCHSHDQLSEGVKKARGGIYLDSRAVILEDGLAEPGEPDESHMIEAIRYTNPDYAMPPKGKLPDAVIADIEKWVEMGLPWPEEKAVAKDAFDLEARRKAHWAWQPPSRSTKPPVVEGLDEGANPIDRFLEHRLAEEGLTPSGQAERATLIRRVTFDLTGLPPTPEEIDAFVRDDSPDAYEKVVDRLLASQAYGEKWARHWLDLMRYAESFGHEFDYSIPHPWVYRNYVIKALNDDIAYDRFVKEHIAGDLVEPRRAGGPGGSESIKATGWWYMHEQTHSPTDVRQHEADRIDNQIDVLSKSFLGITLACARCHDHKFDAIGDEDYYAMAGYLQSSRMQEAYLGGERMPEHMAAVRKLVAQGKAAFDGLKATPLKPTTFDESKPDPGESEPFQSFNGGSFDGWAATGWAWGDRPTVPGQWDPTSGKAAPVVPGVAHSGLFGKEAVGTLRSPEFDVTHNHVWLRIKGKGEVRAIIDGYIMNRHNGLLFGGKIVKVDTKGAWQWVHLTTHYSFHSEGNHRAFIEIIDDARDGFLMVDEVRTSPRGPAPPQPDESAISLDSVDPSADAHFAELTKSFNELTAKTPNHTRALAIVDGTPEDSYVHLRGSWKRKGETIPRRFLEALGASDVTAPANRSGRLELAESIVDPNNPLTARVQVNRLWHHLFGRGLVPTVDNFGVLGQAPSHPELLDYLAVTFMDEDDWSNKAMIKRIVTSRAYRRSSDRTNPTAEEKDPTNALLHRQNIRRLTAEGIRDSILAVSGSLRREVHGRSVDVFLTAAMQGRGRPRGGPLDGAGYRSIYLSVRRNFLSPMMLSFDRPIPFSAVGRRNVTNVPGQSLTLMNDPFVHDQATKWEQRIRKDGSTSSEDRLDDIWMTALGRMPTTEERAAALAYVREHGRNPGPTDRDLLEKGAWRELCHAVFNLKEFIYVR